MLWIIQVKISAKCNMTAPGKAKLNLPP